MDQEWVCIGEVSELERELSQSGGLKEIVVNERKIALTFFEGKFGALNNKCNHMGGPLGKGKLLADGCIECPWHYWAFDRCTGVSARASTEPLSSAGGTVPHYPLKTEGGALFIDMKNESKREPAKYNAGSGLGREPKREPGKIRVLGLSTTAMDRNHRRYSTSEDLLKTSLAKAEVDLGVETKFISLSDLDFRHCEGFYSKSEKACTWPCSITKLDPADEMRIVYEAMVHWADVVIVGTPIRWGSASSLYYKMAERLNSVQNQITMKNRVLIQNKVAGFVITGGQDNIQSVAGQMLNFFGELGFVTPPFPYMAHSRGWSAEDMEQNMDYVQKSEYLHQGAFDLVERSVETVKKLLPADALKGN